MGCSEERRFSGIKREKEGEQEREREEGGDAERQWGEMTRAVQKDTETGTNIKTTHGSTYSRTEL